MFSSFPYPPFSSSSQQEVFGNSTRIQLLDVTRLSMLRPDAHPKAQKEGSHPDCSHWCLPGVPDAWANVVYSKLVPPKK